jgi:hypothetical protein
MGGPAFIFSSFVPEAIHEGYSGFAWLEPFVGQPLSIRE